MTKYLVLYFYNNEIEILTTTDTYEDAYAAMKNDYSNYCSDCCDEKLDVGYIDKDCAYAIANELKCFWNIRNIQI